jgi:filamentous hemagglutinin
VTVPRNSNGVYEAIIEVRDPGAIGGWRPKTNNNGKATMFPDDWTKDRILVELDAAWRSPQKVMGTPPRPNGATLWSSVTPSGVRVEGYFQNGLITTVYPKI